MVMADHWNKDPIAAHAEGLPYVGLSLTTQHKHMTWISALVTYLEGHNPALTPKGLNFTAPRQFGLLHALGNTCRRSDGHRAWSRTSGSRR